MRLGFLVLYASSAVAGQYAVAQDPTWRAVLGAACIDLNETARNYIISGRLKDAESMLSAALANPANGSQQTCSWLILHNLATVMGLSWRLAEAEVLEQRSLKILEKSYPSDNLVFLRPLQLLAQIQFAERKIANARETLQRLQSISTKQPADRAIVHGLAATLLLAEGRRPEAEAEYLQALGLWEEAGRGETADAAAVLNNLVTLYIVDGRYREAGQTLDRAIAIVTVAKDAVATDRIGLFSIRAELHARQGEWREAEADLGNAISAIDRDTRLDPAVLKRLLVAYAHVLRKNHRRKEARSIEVRAAALQAGDLTPGVVDLSELLAKSRSDKK